MKIEAYGSFIEFELTFEETLEFPSFGFSIKVENKDFKGEVHEVYFWLRDLEDFVFQLEILEKSRQGKASLKEMSHISEYRSFYMEIFSIDKAGHFCLSLEIQKISYTNSKLYSQNKLLSTFELDPSSLPTILAEFKAYLS